jgi:hypothetical protein
LRQAEFGQHYDCKEQGTLLRIKLDHDSLFLFTTNVTVSPGRIGSQAARRGRGAMPLNVVLYIETEKGMAERKPWQPAIRQID